MQKFTPVVYFVFLPLTVNWQCHVYKSLQPDVMENCEQVHLKVFRNHTLFPSMYRSIFFVATKTDF